MTDAVPTSAPRTAITQIVILLLLGFAAFFPIFTNLAREATRNPEAAHALAAPVLIGLLIWLRRKSIVAALGSPSIAGVAMIFVGLAIYVGATFPFNYGTVRGLAVVPIAGGAVLAVGGWRCLMVTLPMLLILAISIPTGARVYAGLIVRPEEMTLTWAQAILDMLPGVIVDREGLDLAYLHGDTEGYIGLGTSNRGASLFMAYLLIGLFVTFARERPVWQWVFMGIAVIPVLLLCNLARVIFWGMLTIYTEASPVESMPRYVSTILSLLLAYVVCAGLLGVLGGIVVDRAAGASDPGAPGDSRKPTDSSAVEGST